MTTVQQTIIVFFVYKSLTDKNRNLDALIYYPTLLPSEKKPHDLPRYRREREVNFPSLL